MKWNERKASLYLDGLAAGGSLVAMLLTLVFLFLYGCRILE